MFIQHDTPEDPAETRLNLGELRIALGASPKFKRRPDVKTVYKWLAMPCPMPSKRLSPTSHRYFLLSHVLAWLDDPQAYYGRKRRAS
jgi:hypothetical protein